MSVEYKAGIARGWKFTEAERQRFNEATDFKYEDEFIMPNNWDGIGDSIFGEWVATNGEPGTMIELPSIIYRSSMNISEWINRFEEAGYDGADLVPPQLYLINQVS